MRASTTDLNLRWNFESAKFENGPSNILVLFDENIFPAFKMSSKEEFGFELTFIAVEKKDLNNLKNFRKMGLLPEEWAKVKSRLFLVHHTSQV